MNLSHIVSFIHRFDKLSEYIISRENTSWSAEQNRFNLNAMCNRSMMINSSLGVHKINTQPYIVPYQSGMILFRCGTRERRDDNVGEKAPTFETLTRARTVYVVEYPLSSPLFQFCAEGSIHKQLLLGNPSYPVSNGNLLWPWAKTLVAPSRSPASYLKRGPKRDGI